MQDVISLDDSDDLSNADSGATKNRGKEISRVAGGVFREVQDVASTEKIISEDLPAWKKAWENLEVKVPPLSMRQS